MKRNLVLLLFLCTGSRVQAQNSFSFNCFKDTLIACNTTCINLKTTIPDIYSSTNSYTVAPVTSQTCFRPYVNPATQGNSANLTIDDRYSPVINISFPFSFYGSTYTSLVASTNGMISFDNTMATKFSHFGILRNGTLLSSTAGIPEDLPSSLYDRALIMGPYHDLDPNNTTTVQKIKYDIVGSAPYRKWIITYYNEPLYTTACLNLATNTHQIVLYETLGIVEVFIFDKEICNNWNRGRSIVGMQDFNKSSAIMAPGRQASSNPWGSKGMNETWRFTPASGQSLFKKVELYTLSGTFVATGAITRTANNLLDVSFSDICPPPAGQTYIVNSVYTDPNNPNGEILSKDTINVSRGVPMTAYITSAQCNPGSKGSIAITSPLGVSYEYSIDGINWQSSNIFSVTAGSYLVQSRSIASNCVSSKVFTVNPDPLSANVQIIPTSCSGPATGGLIVDVINGNAPYSYSLNNNTFQASNTFTGLPQGTYLITVKDATGCIFTSSVTINFSGPGATIEVHNTVCGIKTTGSVSVTVTSGFAPFSYSLNGGQYQSSNIFDNLAPGNYTVTVKDATSCPTGIGFAIKTDVSIPTTLGIKMPACNGYNNGSITLHSTGASPFLYSINSGSFQPDSIFRNLSAGEYTFRIKDTLGCVKDTTMILQQPNPVIITALTTNASSCNSIDGQITVKANGGTTPYLYSLDNGVTNSKDNLFTVMSGFYTILITDSLGCSVSSPVTVPFDNNTLTLELGADRTMCFGDSLKIVPAISPAGDYYRWKPASGISDSTSGSPKISPADTSKYILLARLGACERIDSFTVNVLHKPIVSAGTDTSICFNTEAMLKGTATNLSGTVNFTWLPAADIENPTSCNTRVFPKRPNANKYILQVTDNYGCNYKVYDEVIVNMSPPVPAFAGADTVASMGVPFQLSASGGVKYLWSPASVLDNPTIPNPIAVLNNDTRFNLLVTDKTGCTGSTSVIVKVYNGATYYIPNAFTPNGDGLNDVFKAVAPGIKQTDYFRIYNRWGKLMFETKDARKGWDGTYIGMKQPSSVYVWIIRGTNIKGEVIQMKGTVTLIR